MKFWYQQDTWPQAVLNPLAWVFRLIISLRRLFYKIRILKTHRISVPVIVVGNIAVGGTGKTPVVAALANYFKTQGYRVGLVSRGYGGKAKQWPQIVTKDSSAQQVGDEPVMLVQQTNVPMAVGPDRVKAAKVLLENFDVNLIISDDGLQHYALWRDVEIVVMDGVRRFGNGSVFPAGPLREPKSRLKNVDAVLVKMHGDSALQLNEVGFKLMPQMPEGLAEKSKRIHAVAAIGFPEQFFTSLEAMGFEVERHCFPDHHHFSAQDITFNDGLPVVMTEKDAVKCQAFMTDRHWVLPVKAELPQGFFSGLASLFTRK